MSSVSIEEAISRAKYNEAVIVNVEEGDEDGGQTREMVLVATLDEQNGGIIWKDIMSERSSGKSSSHADDEDAGLDQAIVRHLRTKRWVLPMLNDHRRNELYDLAIAKASVKAARNVVTANRSTLVVLDIGTGTGLLAMMAARHCRSALDALNAQDVKVMVTSVEMASAMARLGRLTIAENGLDDIITVVEGHSSDSNFVLEDKADLCTSELLESGLLGEGVLPSVRDAWDRHLHPDAAVVPMRARVYAQVLEGKDSIACYRGPSVPLLNTDNVERLCVSSNRRDVLLGGSGGCAAGVRVPIKAEALFTSVSNTMETPKARPLSEPALVLDFDFANPQRTPPSSGSTRRRSLSAIASGTAHGVLFWWQLDMEEDLMYTTEEGKGPWQDHWQQCLYVFGADDDECPRLKKGKAFILSSSHDDFGISFGIDDASNDNSEDPPAKQQKVEQVNGAFINKLISPDRALQLNDKERSKLIRDAVKCATSNRNDEPMLDLSDFSLCGIMAAISGATNVTSLESSTGELPMLAARVAQLGNCLPRSRESLPPDNQCDGDPRFQIINAHAESLVPSMFHDNPLRSPVEVVFAEPYYHILEGWHLQEALNLYYVIHALKERNLFMVGYLSCPHWATVMGCAVQLDDIAPAYRGLERDAQGYASIRGYRHDAVERHSNRYHAFDVTFPLFQYRHKLLTEPFRIATIPYGEEKQNPVSNGIDGNAVTKKARFEATGACHAMVYWIEYGMKVQQLSSAGTTADGGKMVSLSTFTRSHRQGIRMLSKSVDIEHKDIDKGIQFTCKAMFGGLGIEDHDFALSVS